MTERARSYRRSAADTVWEVSPCAVFLVSGVGTFVASFSSSATPPSPRTRLGGRQGSARVLVHVVAAQVFD